MDYEKAYKASLKTAAQWIKDGCTDKEKICLECVFPELRESEDERIRMKLFHTVRGTPKDDEWFEEISKEAMLAWLEKQKEQKPVQTSEEKEYIRTLKSLISDFIRDKQPEDVAFYQKIYDWLDGRHVEQKPAEGKEYSSPECGTTAGVWSEEDEKMKKTSISFLKDFADKGWENAVECIDWLKSLRPSWKPTYEQMEALRKAVNKLADTEVADSVRLSIMYDHLKELM